MNAQELLAIMKERRSYRQFDQKQITEEQLNMILEAGLYAPNAGGRQSSQFLVTQDKEVSETLGRIARGEAKIAAGRYVNKAQPSIIDNPEIKSALYGAPTVITLFAPSNFMFSEADCVAAGQNMLLMVHALGLGGCMISQAQKAFSTEYGQKLLREKGITEDQTAFYHIIVGYPKGETYVKERKKRIYK